MYRLAACSLPARFSIRSRDCLNLYLFRDGGGCCHMEAELPSPENEWNLLLYALSKCHLCYCHWCSNISDINAMLSLVSSKTQSFSQRGLNKGLEAFKGSSAFDGWITSDIFWSNLSETFTVAARYLSIYLFYSCQQRLASSIIWLLSASGWKF